MCHRITLPAAKQADEYKGERSMRSEQRESGAGDDGAPVAGWSRGGVPRAHPSLQSHAIEQSEILVSSCFSLK